ncbi:MAG: hypothetical protein AAGE65_14985 [Planctomycetota bacterium]
MPSRHAVFPLVFLLLLTLAVPGCVKFKHALSVKPDGSGRIELTFGFSDAMLAHQGEDAFSFNRLDALIAQEDRGFVAFSAPETWSEHGFTYQRIRGYFEDVNRVVIEGDEDTNAGEEPPGPTTFAFDSDGGTLTISRCLLEQVALELTDVSASDPLERAAFAAMLEGLRIEESVTVPGEVTAAGPFEIAGTTAVGVIDGAAMLDEQGTVLTVWRNAGAVEVKFEPNGWDDAERDAWRDELAAAKEAWSAIKEGGSLKP